MSIELTGQVPSSWPALAAALSQIPTKDVPIKLPAMLVLIGQGQSEVAGLLDQWSGSTVTNLKKAVGEVRKVTS